MTEADSTPWVNINTQPKANAPESATIIAPGWAHWSIGDLAADPNDDTKTVATWNDDVFGVYVLPGVDGGVAPVFAGGSNVAISASSKNQAGARERASWRPTHSSTAMTLDARTAPRTALIPIDVQQAFDLPASSNPAMEANGLRLLSAWRRGDMQVIAAEFDRALTVAPELQQALVTQRNVAWADELKRRAARPGTILVAVGAGHMTGTSALPALLSARGFRVARVQ